MKKGITKRVISLVLSLIIGLGTFVSMSAENFRLVDWLGIRACFTAFADEEPTPAFYRENELVGIYNPDYTSTETLYYKITDNGAWTEYSHPFAIPAFETTAVYAKIGENGTETGEMITSSKLGIGNYTEGTSDLTISYNNLTLDFARYYNSKDNKWIVSVESIINIVNENVLDVELPTGERHTFIKDSNNHFVNELTGYTANIETQNNIYYYVVTVNDIEYTYNRYTLDKCIFHSVSDKYGNEITYQFHLHYLSYIDGASREFKLYQSEYEDYEISSGTYIDLQALTLKDPNNNSIIYRYDDDVQKLYAVEDQTDRTIASYEYDPDNDKLSKSNDKNIRYNNDGRVASVIYDSGEGVVYTYNDAQMSYTETSTLGYSTTTVYNDAFLPVSYTDESGNVTTYTYTDDFKLATKTSNGETITYTYNNNGDITSETSNDTQNGESTQYLYYNDGKLKREKTGNDYTYYVYNNDGDVSLTAYADGTNRNDLGEDYNSSLTYDEVIMYNYDSKGRVTQEVTTEGSDSETVQYGYDSRGNTTSINTTTVENNETTTSSDTYTYDLLDNVLTQNSDNELTTYTYDEAGRTLLVNEAGKCTRTIYDNQGRVIQEIGPEDYDSACEGLPSDNTYSNPNVGQRYTYNSNNQVVSEINRLNVQTTYSYHTNGTKATEIFDTYKYEYNERGNIKYVKIKESANSSNYITYAHYNYDTNTNRNISIAYGNGQTVYYVYDTNGNVVQQNYKDSPNAEQETQFEYTYDNDNKLTEKDDYLAEEKTVYASDGTVTVYDTSGENDVLIYSYKDSTTTETVNNEEVTTRTVNKGFQNLRYAPNEALRSTPNSVVSSGNTSTITANSNSFTLTDTEDSNGSLTEKTVSTSGQDLIDCEYTYDSDGNITEMDYGNAVIEYTYDNEGRIETKTTSGIYSCYQKYYYDNKGQLIRCDDTYTNKSTVYTYDNRGNMTDRKDYAYTTAAEITQTTPSNEAEYEFEYENNIWVDSVQNSTDNFLYNDNYVYDENGNILNIDYQEFEWTNGRQLESITYHGIDETWVAYSFTYDENGIRTTKQDESFVIKYIYDGDKLLAECRISKSSGNVWDTKEYLYDGNDEIVGFTKDNATYFYIKDAEGDVIGVVNSANGNIAGGYSYDPWGKSRNINTNDSLNPIRYRGYYYDYDMPSYYLQSRYYRQQWGRFLNADLPEIAQESKDEINGLNLFAYCCNDPVNNSDPTGYKKRKAIIYSITQFMNESKAVGKNLESYFDKNIKVYYRRIDNKNGNNYLTKKWNDTNDCDIAIINCHGGTNNINGLSRDGVLNLNFKKIKLLILLVCFAGHIMNNGVNITFSNIASAIISRISSKCVVVASNDSVISLYPLKLNVNRHFYSEGKTYGWSIYTKNNNIITWYSTNLRIITIKRILKYIKKNKLGDY